MRRNLMGKGLNGPSLPLDVGQTDEIPVHLRRLVALRDQTCRHPGGCQQPAARCEPHHVVHRADGGHTSLTGLQEWCWWHHHVLLHQLGWTLTVHPDGTSKITGPDGKTIHSHSPPSRPGLATPQVLTRNQQRRGNGVVGRSLQPRPVRINGFHARSARRVLPPPVPLRQSVIWDYSGALQKAQMDVAELQADESFRLDD
jgi:hypothetical protein